MDKLIAYIKASISELRKVTWPTKKQTTTYSLLVIGISVGMTVFFLLVDNLLNLGMGFLIK